MRNHELLQAIIALIKQHRPDMVRGAVQAVLTIKELAVILKVSEGSLARHVRSGKIPSFKVGGARRFILAEVLDAAARECETQRLFNEKVTEYAAEVCDLEEFSKKAPLPNLNPTQEETKWE